jgi:hypothetical protein
MAMMRTILLLLFISGLFLPQKSKAQFVNQLSLDAIRIGIDPIKSWSMLFNANKYQDRPVFFNFVEGYAEFLVHLRTSVVLEGGYSNSHWNQYNNTFFYNSKGYFFRAGLDFNVTEPDPDFEVDLGWRIGANAFTQSSHMQLHGDYWQNQVNTYPMQNVPGSTFWGEILLDAKFRIFKNYRQQFFQNLWFHSSLRLRFKQNDLQSESPDQYYFIPGYGFNNRIMPGFHFTLSYFIKLRERKVYRIHHVHDNRVLIHDWK